MFARGTTPVSSQRDDLIGALAARDELIAALGHELRNSIAPLVLLADQCAAAAGTAQPPRLELLTRHLRKLIATLDRVTEVSQLREGKLVLAPAAVDLGEVVDEVIGPQVCGAREHGVDLRVDAAPGVVAWCDRARIKQVVAALVSNAIKHSGGGAVDVIARTGRDRAELVVHDHGRGIPEPQRAHLFDRFEHKAPRQPGSLGVGLWVVRTLCQAMGGAVTLDPSVEPGARFRVTLPRG